MPDISLALSLLKKPIEAVIAVATGEAGKQLAKVKAAVSLKKLYQKLNATQRVKTIWNVDRALSLSTFYYPVRIKTTTGKKQVITSLDDFPTNAVVVSGTVGQGKSILLRYLLGKEIRSGSRVPILIELRRVPASGLEPHIHAEFGALLEITHEKRIFELFAEQGKVSLLLDGYDEIEPERVPEITNAIESLVAKFPEMRIVVTSRPDSGIDKASSFDVVPIAKLEPDDLEGFFGKILSRDKPLARMLVKAVKTSSTEVQSLTSTPLLATLLTIVYRANQTVPSDFSEFYDALFQILLVRHDLSKPGYRRVRKTKLSDRQIQQVFEAYCFKTKATGSSSIPRINALEYADKSLSALNIIGNETDFLHDVVKVTCLLQEEGGRVEFVHQSVQEFFAARYIVSRPEAAAQSFYQLLFDPARLAIWIQVLTFLNQIDKYRSSRYFFVPRLEATLTWLGHGDEATIQNKIDYLLNDSGVKKIVTTIDGKQDVTRYLVYATPEPEVYKLDVIREALRMFLFVGKDKAVGWASGFQGKGNGHTISYMDIVSSCGVLDEARSFLRGYIEGISDELKSHRVRVNEVDASMEFMNI